MIDIFGKLSEFTKLDKTSSLEIQITLEEPDMYFNFCGLKFYNTKKITIAMALKIFFLLYNQKIVIAAASDTVAVYITVEH